MNAAESGINLVDNAYLYHNKGEDKLRVLILEDLASDAALIKLELRKLREEFETSVAANKDEFFSQFESFKPHIILSDYNLPQFTGMEALNFTQEKNPYIPFIICTGSINEETAVACIKSGADDYVLKDSMGRLASAIENALHSKNILIDKEIAVSDLQSSEENFRALAENAPDNIYKLDENGVILYVSRDVDGKDRQQVIGQKIYDFIAPHNVPRLETAVQRVFANGISETVEIEGNPDNPESHWYLCRLGPVMDQGKVASIVFIPGRITERVLAEQETKRLNERLHHLTRHLENVRDEEKERIAQEIHDQLGQELTGNKLGLFWIKQQITSEEGLQNVDKIVDKVDYLVDLTTTIIQTVRRIALELRPVVLDNMGLVAALEWHVENYNQNHETICNLTVNVGDLTFDKEFSTNVYRIVQEALTNIDRHAQASQIDILFERVDNQIHLLIRDNGIGIDMEKAKHSKSLGLFGIKERIRAWKGDLVITGERGKGTTLETYFDVEHVKKDAQIEEIG